ncbi:hypothetical protein Nepgr_015794 [Nepenthes gracilis]|uniref:Uncharacterized protein n=1 Tax=Nepenthes gracilis TaxID=150966 RepID=A0AAD3SLM6_NEPGR|nr:hypothetical protein Nepgr_015794 [Nepenthes gracilis]
MLLPLVEYALGLLADAVMDYLLLDSTVADSCYMMYSLKFEAGVVPLGLLVPCPDSLQFRSGFTWFDLVVCLDGLHC